MIARTTVHLLGALAVVAATAGTAAAQLPDPGVKLDRTRTYYKRLLDRLVFQARLNAKLRIDEAGRPFLLIGR